MGAGVHARDPRARARARHVREAPPFDRGRHGRDDDDRGLPGRRPGRADHAGIAVDPAPPPSNRELFIDNAQRHLQAVGRAGAMLVRPGATLQHARQAWPAIRELLAEEPATRTSLDRMVGPARSLAVIRNSLDKVKTVAHAHGATVNDVLLALTAGGLRAVPRHRGEPVEDTTVRAYVPVSLRPRVGGPQQGNLIAQMAVPLAMRESDAGDELRRVAAETATRKMRARTSLGTLIRGRLERRLMLFICPDSHGR